MAINYSYPKDLVIESADLFLGIRASDNRTVNYTAKAVSNYLNTNAEISISSQLSFRFTTISNIAKTISFPSGLGDGTLFSAITELVVSIIDASSSNVTIYLDYLIDSDILLSQQNEPNNFGHYKITGYTQNGIAPFYTLTLEFIGGYGSIIDDTYYDIAPLNLNQGGGATPNLQQITDVGSITTNAISSVGGFFTDDGTGNSFQVGGSYFAIYDSAGGLTTNFGNAGSLYIGDAFSNAFQVNASSIELQNPSAKNLAMYYGGFYVLDNPTGDTWTLNFPVKPTGYVGTFAMLDDIPVAQDLQSVTDEGKVTTNDITVKDTVSSAVRTTIYDNSIIMFNAGAQFGFLGDANILNSKVYFNDGGGLLVNLGVEGGNRTNTFLLPNKTTGTYKLATTADILAGTVTSVAALTIGTTGTDISSTVVNSTTTPVITVNIPDASATARGALKSSDWSTFNSKQSALTFDTVPTNGSTNPVESNGVFDGLSVKEEIFSKTTTTSAALTGTIANTILRSALILANTFTTGSYFSVFASIQRVGGNSGAIYRMYVNTTSSLTGATLLATVSNGATNLYSPFSRNFPCRATNIVGCPTPSTNLLNDIATTGNLAYTTAAFNFTVDQYIIIAVQPSSALDSFTNELLIIKGNK